MTNYERYNKICNECNILALCVSDLPKCSGNKMIRNYRRGLMSESDLYNSLHMQMSCYDSLSVEEKIEVWEVAAYLDPFEEEFHLQEYYPEEYECSSEKPEESSCIKKPLALRHVSDAFWKLYAVIESASHLSDAEIVKVYGTEGLDVITSMFLDNFNDNMEVSLHFHNNCNKAGEIKIQHKKQVITFISMGYIPVPIK